MQKEEKYRDTDSSEKDRKERKSYVWDLFSTMAVS